MILFNRYFQNEPTILDGEYYAVSIPLGALFSKYVSKKLPHQNRYNWDDNGYMLLDCKNDQCVVIMSAHNMKPVYSLVSPFTYGCGKDLELGPNEWFFRPVLIPLNQNQEFTPVMKTQYQNGEIVKLGTFHYSEGIYQPGKLPDRYDKDDSYFTTWFDDSDGAHDLSWMVWDGILVCCHDLLVCPPTYLFEQKFITDYTLEYV